MSPRGGSENPAIPMSTQRQMMRERHSSGNGMETTWARHGNGTGTTWARHGNGTGTTWERSGNDTGKRHGNDTVTRTKRKWSRVRTTHLRWTIAKKSTELVDTNNTGMWSIMVELANEKTTARGGIFHRRNLMVMSLTFNCTDIK